MEQTWGINKLLQKESFFLLLTQLQLIRTKMSYCGYESTVYSGIKSALTGPLKQKFKSNHCQMRQKRIFKLFRKKEIWNFNESDWNCFDKWHSRKDMQLFNKRVIVNVFLHVCCASCQE